MLAIFLSSLILFVLLSPGVLIHLPKKYGKITIALIHSAIFSLLFSIVLFFMKKLTKEGLKLTTKSITKPTTKPTTKSVTDPSGNIVFTPN